MRKKCFICRRPGKQGLCEYHAGLYIYDKILDAFRLKKTTTGSRYTQLDLHASEIELTKILEDYYGPSNIVTSYHPLWAKTPKKVLYEYDIYIISKKILIEYNGIQHYQFTSFFHDSIKTFKNQQKRDLKKIKLANKQHIPLIIFRYDEPIFKDYVINKIEKRPI